MKFYQCSLRMLVVIILTITCVSVGEAAISAAQITFRPPQLKYDNGYTIAEMDNAIIIGQAGNPALPSQDFWFLLPPGHNAISVSMINEQWITLPGEYNFAPIPPAIPLSHRPDNYSITPNQEVFGFNGWFPASSHSSLMTHLKRGYALTSVIIHPLRWNPITQELQYLASGTLTVESEFAHLEQEAFTHYFRGDNKTKKSIAERVINPIALDQYPTRDDGIPEAHLIITTDEMVDAARDYAQWRDVRGIKTHIYTVDDLINGLPGRDLTERIRNGIRRAYQDLNIGSVLLLGDVEQIPHRGMYGIVGDDTEDFDIPADLYYAGLDGDWTDNRNPRWGELHETDLLAEVLIGRLAVDTPNQALTALRKVTRYSDRVVADDVLKVLMVGEDLGWAVEGGAYMDEIYTGSERMGHRTVGYPNRFQRTNLYDRNGEWDARRDLAPLIADGSHFINHMGHAYTDYVMKFYNFELSDNIITNNGLNHINNIVYSQGCYAGAFDNRGTEPDDYISDCIAERFTAQLANSFVAFICNSRYGWGTYNSTDGASQQFHRRFTHAMLANDITVIGAANERSKEDLAAWVQNSVMLWCYYETNLLGDPLLDMWTDVPTELEMEYESELLNGSPYLQINVQNSVNAVGTLHRDGEVISVATSSEDGIIVLPLTEPIIPTGWVSLTVTASNRLPFYGEIEVVPAEDGMPYVSSLLVMDEQGNNDGRADAGESFILAPQIFNLGLQTLEGISVNIVLDDPMVQISDGVLTYPDILYEQTETPNEDLFVSIDENCPDGYAAELNFTITDQNQHQWEQTIYLTVSAPILGEISLSITDEDGNNNGKLDSGEEVAIDVLVSNIGSGSFAPLLVQIECESPMVELLETEKILNNIAPMSSNNVESPFRMIVSEECPNPWRVLLYVRLYLDGQHLRTIFKELPIGGYTTDFEHNSDGWETLRIDGGENQWHRNANDNSTPNGSFCFKVGRPGAEQNYSPNLNCALIIPDITLSSAAVLTFMHKINAEASQDTNTAFDGGFLEARFVDEEWETIYPIVPRGRPPYPYVIRHGQSANPLPEGQECYSGDFDWQRAAFDLTHWIGRPMEIRFHFGSDASVNRKGWLIDDVEISLLTVHMPPTNLTGEIEGRGAYLTWDSPIYRDDFQTSELQGYRLYREFEIMDTLITDRHFFDDLVGIRRGEVSYFVTAIYSTGESELTNILSLFWPASIEEEQSQLLSKWSLTSAFPNPFNAQINVQFNAPHRGKASLVLYDLQGRGVITSPEQTYEMGSHIIALEALNLPAGVYVAKLSTPMGIKSTKVVLIR